jgi:hypothetical protein
VIDLEAYLKTKLNESIDAELGPRRQAPPFAPPTPSRTWVRPVLAAASVLVVAGAAVAIGQVATSNHATQPPATGHHTQPPATGQPTQSPTTPPTEPTPLGRMAFHGASIAVPTGWTARRDQAQDRLCLSPTTTSGACAIRVTYFVPGVGRPDVNQPGGYHGDSPQWCAPQTTPAPKLTGTATRDFGGRAAQWRTWDIDCPRRKIVDDQYVVPEAPGFVLYAHDATPEVQTAIDVVAQQSELPAQGGPTGTTSR